MHLSIVSVGGDYRERAGGPGVRHRPLLGDPDLPWEGSHGRPEPRYSTVQGYTLARRGDRHPVAGEYLNPTPLMFFSLNFIRRKVEIFRKALFKWSIINM